MTLRLFEPNLANVKPDLRRLYVADAEHGYRLDLMSGVGGKADSSRIS
jgi:hypothetical protein